MRILPVWEEWACALGLGTTWDIEPEEYAFFAEVSHGGMFTEDDLFNSSVLVEVLA